MLAIQICEFDNNDINIAIQMCSLACYLAELREKASSSASDIS